MRFYVTFGFGQPLQDCYAWLNAPNAVQAREDIVAAYGDAWAFIYTLDEFMKGWHEDELEVPFGTPNDYEYATAAWRRAYKQR